jgi:hypothetical protein
MSKFLYAGAALMLMSGIACAQTATAQTTTSGAASGNGGAMNNPDSQRSGAVIGQGNVNHQSGAANNYTSARKRTEVARPSTNGMTGVVTRPSAGSPKGQGSDASNK